MCDGVHSFPACRAILIPGSCAVSWFYFPVASSFSQEAQWHAQLPALGVSDLHMGEAADVLPEFAFLLDTQATPKLRSTCAPSAVTVIVMAVYFFLTGLLRVVSHLMPLGHLSLPFPFLSLPVVCQAPTWLLSVLSMITRRVIVP